MIEQANMRGADILVEMLIEYGVDIVFGVPDHTKVPFYAALQGRAREIRHVTARDKRSTVLMVDAFGRFTTAKRFLSTHRVRVLCIRGVQ
jgi:acetolactate synthase-1/2/3 large subunit